jgi:hypothetical protein
MAWNTKFKKASAARRRQAESPRPPVAPEQITDARAAHPEQLFAAAGLEVRERNERELSIRHDGVELYRSTLKNGSWVHCHHDQTGIGDNIAMARELNPGRSFPDAVFDLAGGLRLTPTPQPPVQVRKPVMPPCNAAAESRGRGYLEKVRGISPETIASAEQAGFLRYTLDGVLTVGRDPQDGEIRAITRRAFDDNAPETKRDLKYSNKADFPAILPGSPHAVVIVEGGIDALAVHDLSKRQGRPLPTVIVAGSSGAQEFLNRPHVQNILKNADLVTVAYENEARADVQEKTDAGHDRQVAKIRELVPAGSTVQEWRPPAGCKDVADLNMQAEQQAQAEVQRHEQSYHGPSMRPR